MQVQDQFGNVRGADNATTVTVTNNGAALLQGTTNVTVVGGVAAFSGLSYQIATTIKLGFTANGLTGTNSGNIVVSPAPASQLTIQTQPSASATAGVVFPQQPVVRVEDAYGNLRSADNSTVVSADIDQGSADLAGNVSITATNGVATFTNLAYPIAETIRIGFTNATLDPDTSISIVVNPASQTITFGALPGKTYGNTDFAVNGSASSGLPVTFSIVSGPATVSGNVVSLTGAGGVVVRASQAGDATFAAAPPVDQSFTIAKTTSAIAVSTSANPSPTSSNVTFTATVTAVPSTPTGTVQFLADGSPLGSPAALSGGIASMSTASLSHGTHVITAQYAGDGNFLGSTNSLNPNQVINSSPVAVPDQLQRHKNSGVKVRAATLLANDTDPDGDALTFVSANPMSANGGTITRQGNWIFYQPPPGFTNADSFTYVIADSGGLQTTGSVSVAPFVDVAPGQNIANVEVLGGGAARVHFNGIPGRVYTIQYAENFQIPDWQPLGTATADAFGKFDFTDTPAANSPARFYRSINP